MHPYSTVDFGRSLSHIGEPMPVPEWGTTVLVRPCADDLRDAIGTYPITVFKPDSDIAGGIRRLERLGLVSVVITVESRLGPDPVVLQRSFDFARPFKTHYLHDRSFAMYRSKHHRYELRRATGAVEVGRVDLATRLDEWIALYQYLVKHRDLSASTHAFPRHHHETLARLPGVEAIGAFSGGRLVSCHLWVCGEGIAMSHLAASSPKGYASAAAYAVNAASIELLSECRVLNFGGASGAEDDDRGGLARFKRGFANATAASYVCGKVLNAKAYAELSHRAGVPIDSSYFPSYRAANSAAPPLL